MQKFSYLGIEIELEVDSSTRDRVFLLLANIHQSNRYEEQKIFQNSAVMPWFHNSFRIFTSTNS